MGVKKIRVPKKSLDRQGEETGLLDGVQAWVQNNVWPVVAVSMSLLVISIVYLGYNAYEESKENAAREEYTQIMEQWPDASSQDNGSYEKLVPQLEKLTEEHPGTKAALNAQVDLAKIFIQLGHYEKALEREQDALKIVSPGHDLEMVIRYHLALTYEQLGKIEEALTQWEKVETAEPSGLEREIHWHLARIYSQKTQYAKAVEQYKKALEIPGDYPGQTLLEEELAFAQGKIESPTKVSNNNTKS